MTPGRRPTRRLRPPDIDRAALHAALRAAIAIPIAFAIGDLVADDAQIGLFALFSGFALLVFADFSGPARARFAAYAGLVAAGAVLIALGTLCSRDVVLAGAGMAAVGFAVLFAGVLNGYFAAATPATLLFFILPAMVPAGGDAIAPRLAGLGIAVAVCGPALVLLWPRRPADELRRAAARACTALAELMAAETDGRDAALAAADTAVHELQRRFVATPYRPTGSTGGSAALAVLVDHVVWCLALGKHANPPARSALPARGAARARMSAELGAAATLLAGGHAALAPTALDQMRETVLEEALEAMRDPAVRDDDAQLDTLLREVFTLRAGSYVVRVVGELAASAATMARERHALATAAALARDHLTLRSAWARNALRGATGLTAAVVTGHLSAVQHSFWVVLGTLGVLRSSALTTGASALQALAGTTAGIVAGGVLVAAIGTNEIALWIAVPPGVLLAAYAPRAISFAVGQAGFTTVVIVLFDLLSPAGWELGLVRVEDVALGCAISLVVGLLLWPRGAGDLLRDCLSTAYGRAGAYLREAVAVLADGRAPAGLDAAREAALQAEHRLDAALRQRLSERAFTTTPVSAYTSLAAGAGRLRLTGDAFRVLARRIGTAPRPAVPLSLERVEGWYGQLALAIADRRASPPPARPPSSFAPAALAAVRAAAAADDRARTVAAVGVLLGEANLGLLLSLEERLAAASADLA